MERRITRALDWDNGPDNVRDYYRRRIQTLPYNPEIRVMLRNIDGMVRDLSQAEVQARRNHRPIDQLSELQRVNSAIEQLEQWLILGTLLS
jgi:hypothetical protein